MTQNISIAESRLSEDIKIKFMQYLRNQMH